MIVRLSFLRLIFFCRLNLFLLGVPGIFRPFSMVLIFASLHQVPNSFSPNPVK